MVNTSSTRKIGRIGIIGAGAMGTSLAVAVSRAAPVVMVCRNPRRAAQIFEHGVISTGKMEGAARPILVRSIADLVTVGGVGALFIATKTTAIPSVCADLKPVMGAIAEDERGVSVISYQNGIDPGREIMELLGSSRVVRMVLHYGAVLRAPDGHAQVTMLKPPHYIGCVDDSMVPVCESLAAMLSEVGFDTVYEPRIERRVWAKAIANAAMSPVAALINATVGQVLESPSMSVVQRLLIEGVEVARAAGIEFGDDFEEQVMGLYHAGGGHVPSMAEDIHRGRESEVGQLNHQIVEYAHRLGVSVPTHETIDSLIETFDWRVYHQDAAHVWDPPAPGGAVSGPDAVTT